MIQQEKDMRVIVQLNTSCWNTSYNAMRKN
jgi:hypothetical protein